MANLEFYYSLKMGWRPAIWPPTTEYLPLTSVCFSGRGLASAAYNYYSQLVYYSKTFRLGCASLTNILKAPSGRLQQSRLCTKMLCRSASLPSSGNSSLLVKIPQITSYITSYIQVDKAIRGKFFIIGCNDLQYQDYLVPT